MYKAENSDNNNVSIYQLGIKYNREIIKKENPEYLEWSKKISKKNTNLTKNNVNDPMEKNVNRHNRYHDDYYMPIEPERMVDTTIEIPITDITHIKTDRKPFNYLYLPEYDKNV